MAPKKIPSAAKDALTGALGRDTLSNDPELLGEVFGNADMGDADTPEDNEVTSGITSPQDSVASVGGAPVYGDKAWSGRAYKASNLDNLVLGSGTTDGQPASGSQPTFTAGVVQRQASVMPSIFTREGLAKVMDAVDANGNAVVPPRPQHTDKSIQNWREHQARKQARQDARQARKQPKELSAEGALTPQKERVASRLSAIIMGTVNTVGARMVLPRFLARKPEKQTSQADVSADQPQVAAPKRVSVKQLLVERARKIDGVTEAIGRTVMLVVLHGAFRGQDQILKYQEKSVSDQSQQIRRERMVGAGVLAWVGVGAFITWKSYLAMKGIQVGAKGAGGNSASTSELTHVVAGVASTPSAQAGSAPEVLSQSGLDASDYAGRGTKTGQIPSHTVAGATADQLAGSTPTKPSTEAPVVELGQYSAKTGAGTIDYHVGQQLDALGLDGSPKSALRDAVKDEVMKQMGLTEHAATRMSSHAKVNLLSEAQIRHILDSMDELDPLTGKPKKKIK
ncbi:MAG: hypothetical protein WAQ24_05550 [Candidatus Saccharimonadales bacterium]